MARRTSAMLESMARVDLIIPTYNGTDYLISCLQSVVRSSFQDVYVVVMDDGSRMPVDTAVKQIAPNATILRNERNLGLTRSLNHAIDCTSSELVVLLNNDTEVEPDWLEALVDAADRNPDAGSVASKLRLHGDRTVIHSAGDTYSVRGMPGNRGVWLEDFGQYDEDEPVFSACAGAALYRRSALEAVRLPDGDIFDTRLFMYCEDVDLGWRLQIRGYPCVFAHRAVVYHHLSATGGGALASYYVARNVWLLLSSSVPREFWATYRYRIIAYQAGRMFRALRNAGQHASRQAVIGMLTGIAMYIVARNQRAPIDEHQYQRILKLIVDG
jgi:GT2 family glycosyltransferase